MITIAGKQVKDPSDLSAHFQASLGLIPGGKEWLNWAIAATGNNRYNAASEGQLIRIIQRGLHLNEYVLFQDFRAAITTLITYPTDVVQELVKARSAVKDGSADLSSLFKQYDLVGYEDLKAVDSFLEEHELTEAPLFNNMAFDDRVLFYQFLDQAMAVDGTLFNEAVDFGCTMSYAVQDFIYSFLFYIEVAQNHIESHTPSAMRIKKVVALYKQLEPLTNYLIDVPNVGSEHSSEVLQKELPKFINGVHFIGYSTKQAALYNLSQNVVLKGISMEEVKQQIETYLTDVKQLAIEAEYPVPTISQNGRQRTFTLQTSRGKILLLVDHVGNLSVLPGTIITKAS